MRPKHFVVVPDIPKKIHRRQRSTQRSAAGFEAPPQFTAIGGAALVLVLGAYFSFELKKEYEEKKTTPSGADFDNAQLTAVNAV